jgi:hypothetical protein
VSGQLLALQIETHQEGLGPCSTVESDFQQGSAVTVPSSRHAGIDPADGPAKAFPPKGVSLRSKPRPATKRF